MINTLVFEDELVPQLAPITTGRLAYAVTCASYRLIDFLLPIAGPTVGLVRPYMQSMQEHDFSEVQTKLDNKLPWTLVVNARLAPTVANLKELEMLVAEAARETLWVAADQTVAAAIVPTSSLGEDDRQWLPMINSLAHKTGVEHVSDQTDGVEAKLFCYPHDVILENLSSFKDNLARRIRVGHYQEQSYGVYLGSEVTIGEHVVLDSSRGPIVIDNNAKIGPFSFLRGPIYLGPNVEVSEHASIKDEVAIGHHCKIGGEVEGTIIEPYSNKKHYGFLGHSYLGSWINLGAGTSNSDLKNTYGIINMTYGDDKQSTGSQFVGCVMGDYSKRRSTPASLLARPLALVAWSTESPPPMCLRSSIMLARSGNSVSYLQRLSRRLKGVCLRVATASSVRGTFSWSRTCFGKRRTSVPQICQRIQSSCNV